MNYSITLIFAGIVGVVVVAASTTTTLPTSTTPAVTCPNPEDMAVYDYFNSDYFTLEYPVDGDQVLKGSGGELSLPTDGPQEILLLRKSVGFLELRFSVKHAATVTLTLTLANLNTVNVQRPAATDAVSWCHMPFFLKRRVKIILLNVGGTKILSLLIAVIKSSTDERIEIRAAWRARESEGGAISGVHAPRAKPKCEGAQWKNFVACAL